MRYTKSLSQNLNHYYENIETPHSGRFNILRHFCSIEPSFSWNIENDQVLYNPHVLSFLHKAKLNVIIGQKMSKGDKRSLQWDESIF